MNHLLDAQSRGYINSAEYDEADHAVGKAVKAVKGLMSYLESTPDFGRK